MTVARIVSPSTSASVSRSLRLRSNGISSVNMGFSVCIVWKLEVRK